VRVTKWVDMGQDVEVEISVEDIRAALSEAFEGITKDRLGEEGPSREDVARVLNSIAAFLNAITDKQIASLTPAQRAAVAPYLAKAAARFVEPAAKGQGE
jgi:hypothetical protein